MIRKEIKATFTNAGTVNLPEGWRWLRFGETTRPGDMELVHNRKVWKELWSTGLITGGMNYIRKG